MSELIKCRAQVHDDCLDGEPIERMLGPDPPPGSDVMQPPRATEDGTYRESDGTIVCDPCYVAITPFTRSQSALHHEIDEATETYRENLEVVRNAPDSALPDLVEIADASIAGARAGSPLWASSVACKRMAEGELERRGMTS